MENSATDIATATEKYALKSDEENPLFDETELVQGNAVIKDSLFAADILQPQDVQCYAANTLAFVGDAVFTLFIRRRLARLNLKAGELTRMAACQVSATSQSAMLDKIMDILTDTEKDIVRRCRNAHTNNHAKNASIADYRRATGLEGLIGHLYLNGDSRLEIILNKCVEANNA